MVAAAALLALSGDAGHGSDRGKQIVGRMMARYFTPPRPGKDAS
jgi:hypothetical protein